MRPASATSPTSVRAIARSSGVTDSGISPSTKLIERSRSSGSRRRAATRTTSVKVGRCIQRR